MKPPARLGLFTIFGVAFMTGLSGAVMPGPLLVVAVQQAVRQGAIAGPLLMIGHGALELVAVILLALGLIRFARSPVATGAIGLLGGAVLIWLAWGTLTSSGLSASEAVSAVGAGGRAGASPVAPALLGEWRRTAALGAVMSMANPYWWLWWATIGVSQIAWASRRGRGARTIYFSAHLLSDVVWYSLVALIVGEGKALLLLRPSTFQVVFLICGATLLALGVVFLRSGVIHLRAAIHSRRGHPSQSPG